ncbi:S-adenosyl-L-methionine-dependent methyltransferase [Aspergillus ibericus CBS 121593]|uniref:S-adenosyl-L-methionine-dependent methyltransferase n=1 Tax=Aspergillus ibericus CBS 121593 TaxID=1448316 RepID=A0A395H702_9EURO|nr:S-adenosyl-L-methionine-dependent methyltransferase [Aspergillus ibericus CBS 121593]RAL03702.1 S-adenosyl-L-methionine-dependent methyltransferase [Aspergillus ibericus CBS 121593]
MSSSDSESSPASFHLADGLGYALQQSHRSVIRLNLQHFLWRQEFGYSIHPSIPTTPAPRKIVDVACGTALWLIDVAHELPPTTQLDGLDIDLTQAPHPAWLPANVHLDHWDLFTPVPPPRQEQYDLVHVRLLVLVLSGLDPMPVIRRLFQLVTPGGYLQWDELDCVNLCLKKVDPGIAAPALEEIRVGSHADGRHDWALDLPRLLAEAGFEEVTMHHYAEPPEMVRAFNDLHLLTMEEFATRLAGQGQHKAAARFTQLIQAGYQESVNGAAISFPRVVVVAKRPA